MHARKAQMAELADAFVGLPGGFGTFEELFEIVTWAQLGLHAKPVGLLNTVGFFDSLLGLVDHAVREGFILARHRESLVTGSPFRRAAPAFPAVGHAAGGMRR
jgi:uncharacterized protein (TIGR00730 family)